MRSFPTRFFGVACYGQQAGAAFGELTATSLMIAEKFGKDHKNVLRAIEKVDCSEKFSRLNFEPCSYTNNNNRQMPMYRVTRDGFVYLVTGFTGKKAAECARFIELIHGKASGRRFFQ